jgi:hypothetical protein
LKAKVRIGLLGAFIALAAALGVVTSGGELATTVSAQPAGINTSKVCSSTAVGQIGAPQSGSVTCTIVLSSATAAGIGVGSPITITLSGVNCTNPSGINCLAPPNGAPTWGQAEVTGVSCAIGAVGVFGCTVATIPPGGASVITINCVAPGVSAFCFIGQGPAGSITITETITGRVGGPLQETVSLPACAAAPAGPCAAAFPGAVYNVQPGTGQLTVGPAATNIGLACAPANIDLGSGDAGASTCRLTVGDNDLFPTTISTGLFTITLQTTGAGAAGGVILSAGGSSTGGTLSLRCGAGGAGAGQPQGCGTGITPGTTPGFPAGSVVAAPPTFTITSPAGSAIFGPVSLVVNYTPDLAQVNQGTNNLISTGLPTVVQPINAFVQPVNIVIVCAAQVGVPGLPLSQGIFPVDLSPQALAPIAVQFLPRAQPCQVIPVDAAGDPIAVAPGVIEVATVNGTLIDASGRLSTNLRIGCGDTGLVGFTPGVAINVNTCTGVGFSVTNLGVGIVELRARYEPVSAAAAAGIQEREARANVAFIAPNVAVSLRLDPNPVTVGQTGTALARFNRDFLLCGVGIFCVNPQTGGPIVVETGSVLNGSVIFSTSDPNIASWVGAQPTATAAAPSVATGFQTTANQTIVRCGFFPSTGSPLTTAVPVPTTFPFGGLSFSFSGPLAAFFGGCDSVSATYRGNNPGFANISATFVPDLPGAAPNLAGLIAGQFSGTFNPTDVKALNVIGAAPSGNIQLARGCNNVSPTVTESAAAYAARVDPAGALVAIWEHQAATNTFRGFSPMAGAPNDLAGVTRLRPVFVCTSGAATLAQPPA